LLVIEKARPTPPVASTTAGGGEHHAAAALALVAEGAGDAVAVARPQERGDRVLHVEVDALVDAVVLQRADHLEAGAVADVGEARVAVAAEVALQDAAVGRAVEEAPHASSSRTRSGASWACSSAISGWLTYWPPRMVSAKCTRQAVAVVDVGERGGDAALRHHRVRLAEQRLRDRRRRARRRPRRRWRRAARRRPRR
jgi:hypothetical protein